MKETTAPRAKTRAEINRDYAASSRGKDAAKRARQTEAYQESRRLMRENKWRNRPFVGWDGEGVTREDGRHDYIMLASSSGARITSNTYLKTARILEFLLDNADRSAINVIYGASYDWNCWLADLPEKDLQRLYDDQQIRWRGYRIKWRRGKVFEVYSGSRSARFFDVVSFFQTSFVNACDAYLGEAFQDRAMIVENKMLRSSFRPEDLDEIAKYNDAELVNLVSLMEEFRERLFRAGLKPSRWDSPGAVAVALMRREGIPAHKQEHPQRIQPAIRHAYYGGRFEVVKFGHVERPAYEYDINSAYPAALTKVPSLAGGKWLYRKGDAGPLPYALYLIEYDGRQVMRPDLPQPLPRRHHDGTVTYPMHVRGWYWSPEYETAKQYVAAFGGELKVIATWIFEPASDVKPFAYVPIEFEKRKVLKAAGDGAHMGIKLGLNSQYGKLAQQVGWSVEPDGTLRIPPYHQLDWAGYVTSTCRAQVLAAGMQNIDAVIAWETDALFTTEPLDLDTGAGLGQWEGESFDSLTYLQSGMYFATRGDQVIERTRGVDKGTLTRDKVLEAMYAGETHVAAELTRFTGVGLALQQSFAKWRRWETVPKNVALYPDGKRLHIACQRCRREGHFVMGEWHSTVCADRKGFLSAEYAVGWANPDNEAMALRLAHYESEMFDD